MELFGDVLTEQGNVDYDKVSRYLERPTIKILYRVSVLTPDEKLDYIIPERDIALNGINYTESYQNGQRRNFTLELINLGGKYTPSINSIWVNDKFRLEVGLDINGEIIWFPKGVYVMGDVTLDRSDAEETISIQLKDKYALFEGKTGTLETAYEVEVGSNICDAIKGILNFTMGNGYVLDYKEPIFDATFYGLKTQATIRAEQGESYSTVIDSLATQLSAEYYYNTMGNLCFYPINETVDDSVKPVIWTYRKFSRDLGELSLSYQNEGIINCVKVVGDSVDGDIYSAVVENTNPASPICIQRIGRRTDAPSSESNIWSDDLAYDLARYYLRKASILGVQFSATVSFNPFLTVNNLCEIEDEFLSLRRDKLLISSISYTSDSNSMSVEFCSTMDLPTNN